MLSAAIAANLTCANLVPAKANAVVENEVVKVENVTSDENSSEVGKSDSSKTSKSKSKQKLIDDFLMQNAKYFPSSQMKSISSELQKLSKEDIRELSALSFRDPDTMTIVSVFLGGLGIDRMLVGKVGTGILKLLLGVTVIPSFIWWLVDIFKISKFSKQYNCKKLLKSIKQTQYTV